MAARDPWWAVYEAHAAEVEPQRPTEEPQHELSFARFTSRFFRRRRTDADT